MSTVDPLDTLERASNWFDFWCDKDAFFEIFFSPEMLEEIYKELAEKRDKKLLEALESYLDNRDPEQVEAFEKWEEEL